MVLEGILRSLCEDKKIESWRRYCFTISIEKRLAHIWKVANRFRNSLTLHSAGREYGSWLPGFASRIVPYFVFDLPEVESTRFFWLAESLSLDEL
jgi:hypothetical protein